MQLNEPTPIKAVRLCLLGTQEIRQLSVCEVKTTSLYEKSLPRAFGPNDIRLGVVDRRLRCGTCNNRNLTCNGHSGHIELACPVYHVAYITHLVRLLRCICPHCYRLVGTDEKTHTLLRKRKISLLLNHLKGKKRCQEEDCRFWLPTYSQVGLTIVRRWPNADKQFDVETNPKKRKTAPTPIPSLLQPLTCAAVLDLLEMVDDEIFQLLDLKISPRNYIITTLLVPPTLIRPAIMFSESSRTRGQDDLTHKLQEILKCSQKLAKISQRESKTAVNLMEQLQLLVAMYMNNEVSGVKKPSKKRSRLPDKCIISRFRGKSGRVRGNLMGKRVDWSSRTVISPGPNIDEDEIGVPYQVAMKLTFEETVNSINLHVLTACVRAGPGVLNGAKSIITHKNRRIFLEYHKQRQNIRLQLGWKVERYLRNGDPLLFNRQPTLRKHSIMAHKTRLLPGKTFRMGLCATGPYNADFDGDEMNCYKMRDYEALAETQLMSVSANLLSAQNNKPSMGIVQDALVGACRMTQPGVYLNRGHMMELMMTLKYPTGENSYELPPPALYSESLWSGHQAFSLLLPKTLNYDRGDVLIVNGDLLKGILTKKHLGPTSGGLVHIFCKLFSCDRAIQFLSDCQRLVNQWMEGEGFSVGLSDCVIKSSTRKSVQNVIDQCLTDIDRLLKLGDELNLDHEIQERSVNCMLSKILDVTGGMVQKDMSPNNAIRQMFDAGSKGNQMNLAQIMGCVGQQSIEGHRIFRRNNPIARTLSCFTHGARYASSRGFVRRSYMDGLTAKEMFFHTMAGREGLVDTSVKTAGIILFILYLKYYVIILYIYLYL